jgi:hypothetical protein
MVHLMLKVTNSHVPFAISLHDPAFPPLIHDFSVLHPEPLLAYFAATLKRLLAVSAWHLGAAPIPWTVFELGPAAGVRDAVC